MDLCNKILSKAPLSWLDVQKQLINVMQTRASISSNIGSNTSSGQNPASNNPNASSAIAVNKLLVKQCTDFLIKHIQS
jgi:surface antigen